MKIEEEDRISNLPEPILHRILSFVDTKQAVQTCLLSTNWRYVWTSLPFLNFNIYLSPGDTKSEVFVDKVLSLRDNCSNIQSFRLTCLITQEYDVNICPWVLKALKQNVQELYLSYDDESIKEHRCQLPISLLFTCKSLTILELNISGNCTFKLSLPDLMSLPNLKTLILDQITFEGDDIHNKILSTCHVLESLTLRLCEFRQTHLNMSSHKLQHLVLENLDTDNIELYAPNLLSFYCNDAMLWNPEYVDFVDVKKAQIPTMKFLRSLQNVEALTLEDSYLKVISGAPALFKSATIQFCNLRYLKVRASEETIGAITYLLRISPNIECLVLEMKGYYSSQLKYPYWNEVISDSTKSEFYKKAGMPLQCLLYRLKIVQIRGVQGRICETMFVEELLKNAMVLEEVALYPSRWHVPKTKDWLIKLKKHLLSLPRAYSSIAISLRPTHKIT